MQGLRIDKWRYQVAWHPNDLDGKNRVRDTSGSETGAEIPFRFRAAVRRKGAWQGRLGLLQLQDLEVIDRTDLGILLACPTMKTHGAPPKIESMRPEGSRTEAPS